MEQVIAKNQNTFAKKQREMDKKHKAEAKRLRRVKRQQERDEPPQTDATLDQAEIRDEPSE